MRKNGIVKWFDDTKGFGFILDTEGVEYFIHQTNIDAKGHRTLFENDKVSFLPAEDDNGRRQARLVRMAQDEKVEEKEASAEEIKQTKKEI